MKKNYLEIFIGSRGLLEGVEMVEMIDIEKYLDERSRKNINFIREEGGEEDELFSWGWDILKEGIYELGLGEEERRFYIDIELKEYKEWGKDWKKIKDKDIEELLNMCLEEWYEGEE